MAEREIDGFLIWAEADKMGDEQAVAFVLIKDAKGQLETKRFNVITAKNFDSLEAAHAAASQVVQRISTVSEFGVPTPLFY